MTRRGRIHTLQARWVRDMAAQPRPTTKGVTDELEDQDVARCFRPHRLVGVYRIERRGEPRSFAFHLRTALLRTRRKYALSGCDGRPPQDEFRAAGASDPHR